VSRSTSRISRNSILETACSLHLNITGSAGMAHLGPGFLAHERNYSSDRIRENQRHSGRSWIAIGPISARANEHLSDAMISRKKALKWICHAACALPRRTPARSEKLKPGSTTRESELLKGETSNRSKAKKAGRKGVLGIITNAAQSCALRRSHCMVRIAWCAASISGGGTANAEKGLLRFITSSPSPAMARGGGCTRVRT